MFCEVEESQLEELFDVLLGFLWGSGLRLNYSKLVLVVCNVEDSSVKRLVTGLCVVTGTLPLPYLGSVLGGNPRRCRF